MAKHFYGLATILFLFIKLTGLHAQQFKQFSGKPESFIKEVNTFTGTTKEDELVEIFHEFSFNWDSARFNDKEKTKIIYISRSMVDKKIRPNPDFYNFLKTLNIFIKNKHPKESFDSWLEGMVYICLTPNVSISQMMRLITNSYGLISENIISQSLSLIWKPKSKNFRYKISGDLRIIFEKTDLVCYAKRDSIIIYNTKGEIHLLENKWYGENGLVTWERAGYDRNNISAELGKYQIDLSKSSYEADSVNFINKTYFNSPLTGHLEDYAALIMIPSNAAFPKFDSYKKEFVIKELYKNVDYEGGFSMQGAKLVGKGSKEKPARLDFYRKDTLKLKATSLYFIFRPEKVIGVDAAVKIYLEKDSIYHGDLFFTYTTSNKEILLSKSENYSAKSPYLNSYHKLDMNFEQLRWRIDEPIILITTNPGSSIGKALFESLNFFNLKEFSDLQYYDEAHPLVLLKKFAKIEGSNRFSAEDFAQYLKKPLDNVRNLLFPLSVKGFIFYDPSTETVEIKQRLYDNLSSSIGKIDYDVLRILSSTNAPLENASIDLRNNDLKINGVPGIFVSDSQNVAIYPKDQSILMKHNRSFQFDGIVEAGLFTFYGQNFFFNYEEFKIALKNVDSIHVKVITGRDNFGKPIYKDVQNTIQDVTGDVLIDKPDNKSGVLAHHEYPIFSSRGNSFVYYDNPSISKGVYKRNRKFYFQIKPYKFDSLNTFKKENMKFEGQFASAGIIPVIPEKLVLQPDFSLGFTHKAPVDGFPIYGGKGRFFNNINLSNNGLNGDGSLNYLSSTSTSAEFNFFPDSMNTIAPDFTLRPVSSGTQFPQVSGKEVNVHWTPYADLMELKNKKKPFQMFNSETSLNGALDLTPKGLTGTGTMDLTTALSSSKYYTYQCNTIDAEISEFKLRSLHKEGFAVLTQNVNTHIDFGTRIGTFRSNNLNTWTEFPENKYIAQLEEFKWKMDRKELDMISKHQNPVSTDGVKYGFKNDSLTGAKFTSTKHGQDSLSFISPLAVYDYENNFINANQVKYVEVADARIFPENEKVIIEPDAKMRPFTNSKILANTETRYHNIYKADASVLGKFNYNAKGKYDYIDENNKIETITFSSISADTTKQTIASGEIVEPDDFTLSPAFKYQGKVQLTASHKYMDFDGYVHIKDTCPNYLTSWLKFETTIDPVDVSIPVNEKLVEINRNPIILGTIITADSIHLYSSLFGVKRNFNDSVLCNTTGLLRYNKDTNTYIIAAREKQKSRFLPGQLIGLNTKTCVFHDEGRIKLGIELGQYKINAAGTVDHDLRENKINIRLMMSLDFYMNNKSMDAMSKLTDSLLRMKPATETKSPRMKRDLANLIGLDNLNKFYDETSKGKVKELPDAFSKSIFLNDVRLSWDQNSRSYRSNGKIGLGYIAGHPINKYVEGYIEIFKKHSGDIMDVYLQIDDKTYYYFGYTRGTMQVLSSDITGFNDPIRALKDSERNLKVEKNKTPYSFLISSERKMQIVRKRWQAKEVPLEQEEDQKEEIQQDKDKQPKANDEKK
jgi:hypothetical protein